MLTVAQRPDAYLYQNSPPEYGEDPYYYSRWSAAHLPLVYKISTDKSPVNTFDEIDNFTGVYSSNGYATFDLSGTYQSYIIGSKVKVTGDVYDGIYEVKDVVAGEYIVLDILFRETDSGTLVKYFENYQVLVKLYAGIATGHPLASTDPMTYIGTFAIAPNHSNIAIIDVSYLVKQKINQNNDIEGTGRPNDLNAWTSFYIEYAETYDEYAGSIPYTFTSDYEVDTLDGCTSLYITNGSFESDLSGWDQNTLAGRVSYPWLWDTGTAKVTAPIAGLFSQSQVFSQEINFLANTQYQLTIVWRCVCASYDKDWSFNVYASDNLILTEGSYDQIFYRGSENSVSEQTTVINFTLNSPRAYLAFFILFPSASTSSYFYVKSVSLLGEQDCKAYIYGHNGTRQFYDLVKNQRVVYGGNMAEYVMNYNPQNVLGKFLTRFETPTIFDGKYFDVSCIIPQATLDIPATEDGLVYRINQYVDDELVSTSETEILNSGDGVYRLRVDDKITQKDATIQLLRKQTNIYWDSIYLINSDSFFVGVGNNFTEVALDVGYIAKDSFVYGINSAIIVASTGFQTKVYSYIENVLTTLTTQTFDCDFLYCVDNLNWIIKNNGTSAYSLISIGGVIDLEDTGATHYVYGVAGINMNNIYICNQSPFGLAQVRKRLSNGLWELVYSFPSGQGFNNGIPSRIAITENYIYVIYTDGAAKVKRISLVDYSTTDYTLEVNSGKGIGLISDTEIVAVTDTHVFFLVGSSYVQDADFDTIRTISGDIGATITDCFYDGTGLATITTTERVYQKQNGTWTTGVGGDYTVGSGFSQYSSRYLADNLVFEVSEVKQLKLDTSCHKNSIYLSWINSLGNWEYFLFTARKTYEKVVDNVTSTRRNIFANFPDNFISETDQDKIRIEAYDKVTVRSQYVSKDQLDIISEIITSIRVQAWYSTTDKITVIVDSKKVTKYSDGDKLYAIEFDIIYPMSQTISQ
jgi:hypothetical protein